MVLMVVTIVTVVMTIFSKGREEIEVFMKSDENASSLTSYYT